MADTPVIKSVWLESGTDRTLHANWVWAKDNTDKYEYKWQYYVKEDAKWYDANADGSPSSTSGNYKSCTYTVPTSASKARICVRAVAKKKSSGTPYWSTTAYSSWTQYNMSDYESSTAPLTPSAPSLSLIQISETEYLAKSQVTNDDDMCTHLTIQIVDCDTGQKYEGSGYREKIANSVLFTTPIETLAITNAGRAFRARCKAKNAETDETSDWSTYSDIVGTGPIVLQNDVSALDVRDNDGSTGKVRISWTHNETSTYASTATSYEVAYSTNHEDFGSNKDALISAGTYLASQNKCYISGIELGQGYFFGVKSINEYGESPYKVTSEALILGKQPNAPTTSSSAETVIKGEPVILRWAHNSVDGSDMKKAYLRLNVNGTGQTIECGTGGEYTLDTSQYSDGTVIKWKVCTKGIFELESPYSIEREIKVYEKPVINLQLTSESGTDVTKFPISLKVIFSYPSTQRYKGAIWKVISKSHYETIDEYGNYKEVSVGDVVATYVSSGTLDHDFNIDARNTLIVAGQRYSVECVASSDVGVESGTATMQFTTNPYLRPSNDGVSIVRVTGAYRETDSSVNIEAYIKCSGLSADDIYDGTVYLIDHDGRMSKKADLKNMTDPLTFSMRDMKPTLDYAEYRVVIVHRTKGTIHICDTPVIDINDPCLIINWEGNSITYVNSYTKNKSQNILRLPFNVDVNDNHETESSNISYIGRENPVSYFGTAIGETYNISTDIAKTDIETLSLLRKLSVFKDKVYVREPYGGGNYYATVNVSLSRNHHEQIVKATLSITRVDGGA